MPFVDTLVRKAMEAGIKAGIKREARNISEPIDNFFANIQDIRPLNEGEDEIMRCIRSYQRPNPYQKWTEEDTVRAFRECGLYEQNINNRY